MSLIDCAVLFFNIFVRLLMLLIASSSVSPCRVMRVCGRFVAVLKELKSTNDNETEYFVQ